VRVTHPFHPLFGREFDLVSRRHAWGHVRVGVSDDQGRLISLPAGWTSVGAEDPFLVIAAGRSPLHIATLPALAALVRRLRPRWASVMPVPEKGAIFQQAVEFSEGLRKSGVIQAGDPLEPASTATTVQMKNVKVVTTAGPFAETKEQLGGYTIVEAENLDEVMAVATRHPLVRAGLSIEVRPIRVGPPQ
jgi:hypothetical protein